MVVRIIHGRPWFAVYNNGEGGDGGGGDGSGGNGDGSGGAGGGAGGAGAGAGAGGKPDPTKEKRFTQEDLNRFLADDRRKHQQQVQKTVAELEELRKAKGLSDQERDALSARIEEMNNSLLTKEEQAKRELEKRDKEYKTALESRTKESDSWKGLYSQELTTNQILRSAEKHGAVNSEQIMELLLPKTRLTEVLGEDGKPTGRYEPKIKFRDEKDGKPVELDLTIEECVKRMKELPERFGNLFKSGTQGGLGGTGSAGSGGGGGTNSTIPPKDPDAYRAWRKKQGIGRSK